MLNNYKCHQMLSDGHATTIASWHNRLSDRQYCETRISGLFWPTNIII